MLTALLAPLTLAARLALPPRCPVCGSPVAGAHELCAGCWGGLRFIAPPWCAGCNAPLPHGDAETRCAACLARPPVHAGVRAAVAYGPGARSIALKLKYGGRLGLATFMARHMARLMPADAELLAPVPLHRWRLWRRGFNQAALVAGRLSAVTGVPTLPDALVRTRATPVLKGLGPAGRRRAVRGVFAVSPAARERVSGRHVALIDDVHTSGATTEACTRVLRQAGAASVTVLCWARVLDGND